MRPLNELKITFHSTFRLVLSHTCLYIYKNRWRFLNTWSRERTLSIKYASRTFVKFLAVFFSRFRYEKMGTCSMILCNATLRTHRTKRKKKTKNLRGKVTMYSAWKNISFVCIFSRANEKKGQEQRVLLSAWYRFSFPSCPLLYTLSEPINCNIPLSFAIFYQKKPNFDRYSRLLSFLSSIVHRFSSRFLSYVSLLINFILFFRPIAFFRLVFNRTRVIR